MPKGWVHATLDLIAFGRPYFDLHKEKDKPYETLGPAHRKVNHGWYQQYQKRWTLAEPFPASLLRSIEALGQRPGGDDQAEKQMVWISHDYFDRAWDRLSDQERKYWEGYFIWVLLQPAVLRDKFGVDVLKGKIHRVIDGEEMWEDCSDITAKYSRLRIYAKAVLRRHKKLQEMMTRYG